VRCRRSPVGVEASVVLVDEELAVEAEVVGVGTEETLGVGRAREELEALVLERLQVARSDSCLRRHLAEFDPAANSRFAKGAPELEHDLASDSLPVLRTPFLALGANVPSRERKPVPGLRSR